MNQDWYCANCGKPSGYQGHFSKLKDGSWGFTCEPKPLITLQSFNDKQRKLYSYGNEPILNGIACPECGQELYDSCPHMTLTSNPPQKNVHCGECGYKGCRIE